MDRRAFLSSGTVLAGVPALFVGLAADSALAADRRKQPAGGDPFRQGPDVTSRTPDFLPLLGVTGNGTTTVGLTPAVAAGAAFVPSSGVLRLPDGGLAYVPDGATDLATVAADDPGALARVRADRAWLAAGRVPGRTAEQRAAAARALLDIRALTQPDGAVAAAWYGAWAYSWPRDGSFMAVALAAAGHHVEAERILGFAARMQGSDGTWQARYLLDGSGVPDDRPWQFDSNGWVPWAVWSCRRAAPAALGARLLAYWPTVRLACDAVVDDLGPGGLPMTARPDYWENAVQGVTIGEAAPFVAGLRAGADLALASGHARDAARYSAAARRLRAGIADTFGRTGYGRYPWSGSGADAAVTFLAPPFERYDAALADVVTRSGDELTIANGGVLPGQVWTGDPHSSWTPETGFFALAAAASGRGAEADRRLDWLLAHRTALGSFPEQVGADGLPQSVAPLGWTDAVYLMTLTAAGSGLPVPPG